MLISTVIACSLVSPQVSAVPNPLAEFAAQTIDLDEPQHGHDEHDTSLLEHNLIDLRVPIITGGFIVSHQSTLLEAANRGMKKWWATTPLGKPFVLMLGTR